MKKLLAILMALCMILALAACGGNDGADSPSSSGAPSESGAASGSPSGGGTEQSSAPPSGSAETPVSSEPPAASVRDTLIASFTQDRGTLDPMFMIGYDNLNGMRSIYEPLWDIDGNGETVWILATGVDMVEPTKWHISIREGVTFANGNPLTAEDVVFSLWRGNNRTGEPAYLPELNLDETKALNDYTVEMILNNYDLSYFSGMTSLMIFDEESFDEAEIAESPNGTGPYELTDYVINSHMNMTAREGYWGDAPLIKNLEFRILSEDAQRVNSIETGTVDISGIPFQDIEYVQTLEGVTVDVRDNAQGKALYFNTSENSVFYDNVDARKAVALGIDRQAIVDIAYSGFATVSRYPLSMGNVDDEERFYDLGVYGIGYNPEMARELAESSGLIDKEIRLINNGSADNVAVCELVKANMAEIGVTVNVTNYDPGSWLSYAFDDTAYDMCSDFTSVPSRTVAQNMSAWVLYHVGGAYTRSPWPGSERYLELINGIMANSDTSALSEIYMELIEIQTEAMLWYGLADMQSANAYNSNIAGYEPMLMGNVYYSKLAWTA